MSLAVWLVLSVQPPDGRRDPPRNDVLHCEDDGELLVEHRRPQRAEVRDAVLKRLEHVHLDDLVLDLHGGVSACLTVNIGMS